MSCVRASLEYLPFAQRRRQCPPRLSLQVKTAVQVEVDGGRRESLVEAAARLYSAGGWAIFWDGLTPKLLRAVVNHAVTFTVFEELSAALQAPIR